MRLSSDYAHALVSRTGYARFEGLQVHATGVANIETGGITLGNSGPTPVDVRISDNLVVGELDPGPGTGSTVGIWISHRTASTTIWNNIVVGFRSAAQSRGILLRGVFSCVSHNTVYDSGRGINGSDDGPTFLRNNVAIGNDSDYSGPFAPESHHNGSSDATTAGTDGVTLSSRDPSDYFRGPLDFRIDPAAPLAAELVDRGAALPIDPCPLPGEALGGVARPLGAAPDLGAYEVTP